VTLWLTLAVCGQLLTALSVLIDRHIVVRAPHIGKPIVYAFYVSVLSGFVIVLAPLGIISLPNTHVMTLSLIYAGAFLAAIYFLYSSLTVSRASDAAPVIGSVSTIATLILAGLFLDDDVTAFLMFPVLMLAAGTGLISHFHFTRQALIYTLASGLAFGSSVFAFKLVVLEVSFLDGFFWTRMMSVVAALLLLVVPQFRKQILHGGMRASHTSKFLVIGNKMIGSVASVFSTLAISLGSVTIVNALSGLQFAFLYLFALLFAKGMPPATEKSRTHGHGGWQTGFGVALIMGGLALLYLHSGVL